MWFARADDGFVIGGLVREDVETLRGVPMLLESTDERVRARLLPETFDDAEDEEQWRRHSTPELERLFQSRAQLVRKDLRLLRRLEAADSWVMPIPDHHVNAWLASLNAARLALFVLNDLTAEQMEREGLRRASKKQREALRRIHFLAELQCVLMGDIDVAPDDDDDDAIDFTTGWSIGGLAAGADEDAPAGGSGGDVVADDDAADDDGDGEDGDSGDSGGDGDAGGRDDRNA